MKTFLLIFIFALFLNADSFYMGRCVKSYNSTFDGSNYILRVDFNSNAYYTMNYSQSDLEIELSKLVKFDNKFTYSEIKEGRNRTEICSSSTNNTLGMTNEQFNFMMALTGLLTSILLVFVIYKKV